MSYKEDHQRQMDEQKAAHALWELWQKTKKEEDRVIWWNALSSIKSKSYITVSMTLWPEDGVNVEDLQKMIENGDVTLPWLNHTIKKGNKVVAEVVRARTSSWPQTI